MKRKNIMKKKDHHLSFYFLLLFAIHLNCNLYVCNLYVCNVHMCTQSTIQYSTIIAIIIIIWQNVAARNAKCAHGERWTIIEVRSCNRSSLHCILHNLLNLLLFWIDSRNDVMQCDAMQYDTIRGGCDVIWWWVGCHREDEKNNSSNNPWQCRIVDQIDVKVCAFSPSSRLRNRLTDWLCDEIGCIFAIKLQHHTNRSHSINSSSIVNTRTYTYLPDSLLCLFSQQIYGDWMLLQLQEQFTVNKQNKSSEYERKITNIFVFACRVSLAIVVLGIADKSFSCNANTLWNCFD